MNKQSALTYAIIFSAVSLLCLVVLAIDIYQGSFAESVFQGAVSVSNIYFMVDYFRQYAACKKSDSE